MKKSNKVLFSALGIAMAAALVTTVSFSVFADCPAGANNCDNLQSIKIIKGDSKITQQVFKLGKFTDVSVGGEFDITISAGKENAITISGDENILPYIQIKNLG